MLINRFSRVLRDFLLLLLTLSLLISSIGPASAQDERIIDIAQLSWQGASAPTPSLTTLERSIDEVSKLWTSFTSIENDAIDRQITFRYGTTLSSPIMLKVRFQCEPLSFASYISSLRSTIYSQLGINDSSRRYLLILIPDSGCLWQGRALVGSRSVQGGSIVLNNTASPFVIAHELGHSLGLGHSNLIRCANGAADGPWASGCNAVTYGGSIDVMGNVQTESPLSVYHQWRLGLLDGTDIYQSWLNEKVRLIASDLAGGIRAIVIRSGRQMYWIEYRRSRANLSYNPGLVIYRSDPPPPSSIISPNASDSLASPPTDSVTTDIWMLNLDNYSYQSSGIAQGSMTLPENKTITLYGDENISLFYRLRDNGNAIDLSIMRKPDTAPPPQPQLIDPRTWISPDISILATNYADSESTIAYFEVKQNDKIVRLNPSQSTSTLTFLNPITSPPTLKVRDLPEGNYSLAVRAIDIWGNVGTFSDPRAVSISHRGPYMGANNQLVAIEESGARLAMLDTLGSGTSLCQTHLINSDGVILSTSNAAASPELIIPNQAQTHIAKVQSFDCLGNGSQALVTTNYSFLPASQGRLVGKWTRQGTSLSCQGRCSASFTTKGQFQVAAGAGSASVALGGITTYRFPFTTSSAQRLSEVRSSGPGSKVVRVVGDNFTLFGLANFSFRLEKPQTIDRVVPTKDASLNDPIQKKLSTFGLTASDFEQSWVVSPISNGTTLNDPTLDLCGATYLSESLRSNRRQVGITKQGSPYDFLSSEVVRYISKEGPIQALADLRNNLAQCSTRGGFTGSDATFTPYEFQRLAALDALPSSSAFGTYLSIGQGSSKRYLLAIFQIRGHYLSGLYVSTTTGRMMSADELQRWLYIATIVKSRLASAD